MSTVNGPFPDTRARERASDYARDIVKHAALVGVDIASAEHDIANAFVIGFEAGIEHASKTRRTVRK